MKPRKLVEQIKADFIKKLGQNVLFMKSGIIKELDYMWRMNPDNDVSLLLNDAAQKLNIQLSTKVLLAKEVKATQDKIGKVWKDYFGGKIGLELDPGDYEKMLSVYQVDFKKIEKSTRDIVKKEITKAVHADYSYNNIRQGLINNGIGTHEAYTLANTAVAQFDNAAMFEYSQQAGIEKYKYDGILNPNSRNFCVKHFGHIYTIEEIKQLDNGQGLPVLTTCGGYNCTHYWQAAI